MSDEDVIGTIEFSVSAGLMPWGDPYQFVRTVTGKIIAHPQLDEDIEAGEIVLRVVLATEAVNCGEDLLDICDADSSLLEGVYGALFDRNGETKEELDIEVGWNNLVLVEKVEVDLRFRQTPFMVQAIETALAMFASVGLVVAVEDWLDLSMEEWKQLGFVRIAGTTLVFRDQLKRNPYQIRREGWE